MKTRVMPRWPVLLIASPAAVAVWSGWVALGAMCGFGPVNLLPGIGHGFTLDTAITLPVGVEAYGAYALGAWLLPGTPARARRFAGKSAAGSLLLGAGGQVIYHLLAAAHLKAAPWPVTVFVSCLPVVALGFGATLAHLLAAGEEPGSCPWPRPAPVLEAAAEATGGATAEASGEAIGSARAGAAAQAAPVPAEVPPDPVPAEPAAEPLRGPFPVPREEPSGEPRPRAVRVVRSQEAERARAEYRKSVRQGQPLTDRALGAKFGKSRTWGASRIREVEDGPALTTMKRENADHA